MTGLGRDLRVLDVKDPANPQRVGQFDIDFSYAVSVEGNLACLVDSGNSRLRVLDISNPRAPRLVGKRDDTTVDPRALPELFSFRARNSRAYLVSPGFLRVLDLSNAAQPVELGHLEEPDLNDRLGIDVAGDRAYVASWKVQWSPGVVNDFHLMAFDVTNPAAISELGRLDLTNRTGPLQVVGDFAYYYAYYLRVGHRCSYRCTHSRPPASARLGC